MAHPTFEGVAREFRWAGDLHGLWSALRADAYRAGGEWVWRVLPRGAAVWLRVPEDFSKELLISRPGHPPRDPVTGDFELGPWETEVSVFLRHFTNTRKWHCLEFGAATEEDGEAITLARFKEVSEPAAPADPPKPPPQQELSLEDPE